MKICIPGFILDKGRSGIGSYVINLIHYLQKVDLKNSYLLALSEEESDLIPLSSPNFVKKLFSSKLTAPLLNIFWYNTYLPFFAKSNKCDILHIPTIRRIPFFKGAKKLIVTVHDVALYSMPQKYSKTRSFYHRHILSRLIKRCDRIVTVSYNSKADIVKFLGYPQDKIEVIYPGINHIRLIQAFELLKKKYDIPHQLILAGADWHGAEIVKDYWKKSVFSESILMSGFLPQEDIVKLYSGCELMVFPSLYEGFGFPVIEAMACGATVACSNTSSLKEIGGPNSILFDPYDVEDISKAIFLSLNTLKTVKTKENNIHYASKFSWEKHVEKLLKVYEGL